MQMSFCYVASGHLIRLHKNRPLFSSNHIVILSRSAQQKAAQQVKILEDLTDDRQRPDYIHTCRAAGLEMSTTGF